ncbi:MAG: hypothetical protein WDW38_005989 [Sanguina aurantia]
MQPVAGGTPPKGAQGTMPLKQKPAVKQQGGGTFRLTSDAKKAPKESLPASVRFVSDAVRSDKVVFVAGATGRTGARIVRELLSAGFVVRAGARNVEEAEKVLDLAVTYGAIPADQAERIVVVPFDIEDESTFVEALGDANKVVCAVGASETAVFDTTGPQRIDGDGTTSLIEAATALGLDQFILISSLGTGKVGAAAGKQHSSGTHQACKDLGHRWCVLERSGLRYVIIRPGGMEKPTDAYKETHQMVLAPRDTIGPQPLTVSRLQVAELVAAAALDVDLAENKVLEVVAETSAPQLSYQALLKGIESDISAEAQLKAREATAEAEKQLAAAQETLAAARSAAAEAEEQLAEVAAEVKEARAREAEFQREVAPVLAAGAAAESALVDAREAAALAVREEAAARAVLDAAKRAAAEGELLSEEDQMEVAQEFLNPPPPPEPKAKVAPPPKKGAVSKQAVEGSADGSVDVEEEESEEEEAPVAKKSAKDFNPLMFFQPKQPAAPAAAASMEEVEEAAEVAGEDAEVEESVDEEQAPPQRKQSGFDSFFNFMVPKIATPKAEVEESVDEEEEEEQTEVEETPVAPEPVTNKAAALSASARASATEVVRVTPPAPVKAVAAEVEKAVATPVKAVVGAVKQAVAAPVKAVVEEVKQAVAAPIKAAAVEVVKAVAVPAMAAAPDVPEPAAAAVASAPPPPPQQTGWFASMFAAPLQLEDDTKSEGETNSERRKRVMDEAKARMAGEQAVVMSGKSEE